jgi:hypothetical protein
MPILDDIMDHDLFGPAIRQGREDGREEAREEAREHLRCILSRQIAQRFGPAPAWAEERIKALSSTDIDDVALRLLDAPSLEDLLN